MNFYNNAEGKCLVRMRIGYFLEENFFFCGSSTTLFYGAALHSAGVTGVPSLPLSHPASRLPHSDPSHCVSSPASHAADCAVL